MAAERYALWLSQGDRGLARTGRGLRTHEVWLSPKGTSFGTYLAVVIDLFSRQVVGWSMRPALHSDLVLQALLAAVWRRKPLPGLMLRRPVHRQRMARLLKGSQDDLQHESRRELP